MENKGFRTTDQIGKKTQPTGQLTTPPPRGSTPRKSQKSKKKKMGNILQIKTPPSQQQTEEKSSFSETDIPTDKDGTRLKFDNLSWVSDSDTELDSDSDLDEETNTAVQHYLGSYSIWPVSDTTVKKGLFWVHKSNIDSNIETTANLVSQLELLRTTNRRLEAARSIMKNKCHVQLDEKDLKAFNSSCETQEGEIISYLASSLSLGLHGLERIESMRSRTCKKSLSPEKLAMNH